MWSCCCGSLRRQGSGRLIVSRRRNARQAQERRAAHWPVNSAARFFGKSTRQPRRVGNRLQHNGEGRAHSAVPRGSSAASVNMFRSPLSPTAGDGTAAADRRGNPSTPAPVIRLGHPAHQTPGDRLLSPDHRAKQDHLRGVAAPDKPRRPRVPPASGIRPCSVSGNANLARDDATRTSQASAEARGKPLKASHHQFPTPAGPGSRAGTPIGSSPLNQTTPERSSPA